MIVKDVDNVMIPLFFYTKGRGSELKSSMIRNEHTITILYALVHEFNFSEPGIRIEESTNI